MVLDGEENETLRVLLEEGLVELLSLGSDNNLCLLLGLLDNLRLELCSIDVLVGLVLLVGDSKVKLLDGRFHVEVLNTGSSLFSQLVSDQLSSNVECPEVTYLLRRSDLRSHCVVCMRVKERSSLKVIRVIRKQDKGFVYTLNSCS